MSVWQRYSRSQAYNNQDRIYQTNLLYTERSEDRTLQTDKDKSKVNLNLYFSISDLLIIQLFTFIFGINFH